MRRKRKNARGRKSKVRASTARTGAPRVKLTGRGARYEVPAAVARAAEEGLQLLRDGKGGKGLTEGAISRARSLARRTAIDFDRARMMRAWFARHKVDRRPDWKARATPGYVAWQLWGGDPAKKWVEDIVRKG